MSRRALWLVPLMFLLPVRAEEKPVFEQVGHVDHGPIGEMSGIVKSRTYADTWWVHNDSGDGPRLYAIDGRGRPIVPAYVADEVSVGESETPEKPFWAGLELLVAAHLDWEDIALGDGTLYVADVGNNFNHRRDLGVYVLPEPNPRQTTRMRPLRFVPVRYPDQEAYPPPRWHYDCEAAFVCDGKLWLLTKHRRAGRDEFERGTNLYRLDTEHIDRQNVLTLVDSDPRPALPTAADLSPDGRRLAVLTALGLWTFERPAEGDRWLSEGRARFVALPRPRTKQAEGVCWDDDETLRISNEQRDLFRVRHAALGEVKTTGMEDD